MQSIQLSLGAIPFRGGLIDLRLLLRDRGVNWFQSFTKSIAFVRKGFVRLLRIVGQMRLCPLELLSAFLNCLLCIRISRPKPFESIYPVLKCFNIPQVILATPMEVIFEFLDRRHLPRHFVVALLLQMLQCGRLVIELL